MITLKTASQKIGDALDELDLLQPPFELYEPVEYMLSLGGKRLRPALVLLSTSIYSDQLEKALKPALGLEIFHNFSLVHDDIMDQAKTRRNHPTVHERWDNRTGILSGDAMMIKAYQLIMECEGKLLKDVLNLFNKTAMQVCKGQQYDINFEHRHDVREDEYLRMIELKTAVLIACALEMGAIIGHAPSKDAKSLYEYGKQLGLAFQLQDDLLDTYGDGDRFGKMIGGDILINKKTYLLVKALKLAKGNVYDELIYWLEKSDFEEKMKLDTVMEIYNDLRIKEITEQKINHHFEMAHVALEQLNFTSEANANLDELTNFLVDRQR